MPTQKQYHRMRETEMEFPQTRREDDPMYVSPKNTRDMPKKQFELEVVYATELNITEEEVVIMIMQMLKDTDKTGWVVVAPSSNPKYGFYQLCPKCDGDKEVQLPDTSKPMFGACPLCGGEGKLVRPKITDKNLET